MLPAALIALATLLTGQLLPAQSTNAEIPAASTALIEQAKQDGLTIEQERYIQSLPKDPKHHWEGYSDKPVPAKLGPNTFMFPMNLYDNQIGPDFQGSVALTLHWPDLKAFPPGARNDPKYSEAYTSNSIMVSIYFVDRRPIDSLMADAIKPRSIYQKDDPSRNLDMRLRGSLIYDGLTPYYTDIDRLTTYLEHEHGHMKREDILQNADDWYISFDKHGNPETFIRCTSREIVGASLTNGQLEDTPAGQNRGLCTQSFVIPDYKINIVATYLRAHLKDWRKIQSTLEKEIRSHRATS